MNLPNGLTATSCVACRGTDLAPFFVTRDWYQRSVDDTFSYVRCAACHCVIANPQPDDATLNQAYAPSSYQPLAPARSLVERLGEPLARREAARLMRHGDPDSSLLDVGCGVGRFFERLQAVGWRGEMRGLEPDERAAAHVTGTLGVPVDIGDVDALSPEPGSLGAVVFRHVIEHVRDPETTLQKIRGGLKRGGVLYVGTPDNRALSAKVFGRYWIGYDPPRHLATFSAPGVRKVLERTGFDVVSEHWDFAPQMWTGSLRSSLSRGNASRWATIASSDLNPLAAGPAVLGALAEVALRRSTMYAVVARAR